MTQAQRFVRAANKRIDDLVEIQGTEIDEDSGLTPLEELEPWLLIDNSDVTGDELTYEKTEDYDYDGNFIAVFYSDSSAAKWDHDEYRWYVMVLTFTATGERSEGMLAAAARVLGKSDTVEGAWLYVHINETDHEDEMCEFGVFEFQIADLF